MITINCDSCHKELPRAETNTVTIKNIFNKKVKLHYCHPCAKLRFPALLDSMLSWTAPLKGE